MNNEDFIRNLIKSSLQRAIQESAAAGLVVVAFAAILVQSDVESLRFYGCLIIMIGAGVIAGIVWSYALSCNLLRKHPPNDVGFWRKAFQAQAKLLRLVPLWYCGPLCAGSILFFAPTTVGEIVPFLFVAAIFTTVFAGIVFLNRRAASKLDEAGSQLVIADLSAARLGWNGKASS